MAEGGGPPSDDSWANWKKYLSLKKKSKAEKTPKHWDPAYPRRLDSLDPFFAREAGKSIHRGKLIDRPRTQAQRESSQPSDDDKKLKYLRMNLTEAMDDMNNIADQITSNFDEILRTSKKSTIDAKLTKLYALTEEIHDNYHKTRCGVPTQYFWMHAKMKSKLETTRLCLSTDQPILRIHNELLVAYDILNSIKALNERTRSNARELERNYMDEKIKKRKFRTPPKHAYRRPRKLPPPPIKSKRRDRSRDHENPVEARLARAKKPKSPLALESTPPERQGEEESPTTSAPTSTSSSATDLGATASASSSTTSMTDLGATASPSLSTKRKKNCVKKAIAKATASIAKFTRKRELLQTGSDELPDIGKLSILPYGEEPDENIDDLCRDSDADTTDDEFSDGDD